MYVLSLLVSLLGAVAVSGTSFDWAMANTTVALCANAYCDVDTYLTRTYTGYAAGFVATKSIDTSKDVQGFVGYMESKQTIFVSYRGSTSIQDWINNLDFKKETYSYCAGCEVHSGFYSAEQSAIADVKSEVQQLLSKFPSFHVVVTGHSLGAAMALLTALDLLNAGVATSQQLRLFNYGCPFVGNPEFSDYASSTAQLPDRNRVTHLKDIVPHIPPPEFGFEHISGEWYQDEFDSLRECQGTADAQCAAQWDLKQTNVDDHLHYLGVPISTCPAQ